MELCLYHPEQGYYTSTARNTGIHGDYYTSPHLGPLFGQLIAKQLQEMWLAMGQRPFTILEYGAGNGLLCHDILKAAGNNEQFLQDIRYTIIEKNSVSGNNGDTRVNRMNDIDALKEIEGCVISNELVDNLSVHRVIKTKELLEVKVDYQDGEFREVLQPARQELIDYFDELAVILPDNFQTEVNLDALEWIKKIALHLHKGYVLTIDYGFPSHELYNPSHAHGNLLCYYQHKLSDRLYENIGEQDITAHVNFSALDHWGSKYGLDFTGFTNQSYFLMGLGVSKQANQDPSCVAGPLLLKTLLVDLGMRMKVLVQQKNLPVVPLSGLRFPMRL